MPAQKIYAGAALKALRSDLSLTQRDFANHLAISVSYLNQMENNNRPIAAGVILRLAQEFDFDLSALDNSATTRLLADLDEAFRDPMFSAPPNQADLQLIASNAPSLARSILDLHRAYQTLQERAIGFDDALGTSASNPHPQPWEEVRDFFHYCDNYIDAIDRAAETAALRLGIGTKPPLAALTDGLAHYGVEIAFAASDQLRVFDGRARRLTISNGADQSTQLFQIAAAYGNLCCEDLFEATLDMAEFHSETAREIGKIGLANYFAGAFLMPYALFHERVRALRHDLEALAHEFSCSIEQVAHRLSTLQRAGHKGIPFFFVRVDQAGTITKRHSATRLQFARFGGACPLWNVHRAFETPGQFLRQLAETPDGVRYFCLAYDVSKKRGSFHAPARRFAIGLGCEIEHAAALVYADDLDVKNAAAFEPIGVSCRICERIHCHQRSVPPQHKQLEIDRDQRTFQPYRIKS